MMYLQLPFEIRDLVRRLPHKLMGKLEVIRYSSKSMKELATDLADLLKNDLDPNVQYVYNGCLVLSDQYEVLLDHVFPPQNSTDLIWYWYAFKFLPDKRRQSNYNLHDELPIPLDEIGELIYPLIDDFFKGKADFIEAADTLNKIIYHYPNFVLNNILLISILIRAFSDHLAMVPDYFDALIMPIEDYIMKNTGEFLSMNLLMEKGRIFYRKKQYTLALQMFEEAGIIAVKHDFNLIQMLLHRKAKVFNSLGMLEEEYTTRLKLTELNPHDPRFQYSLAYYYIDRRRYDEALSHIQLARKQYNFENLLFVDDSEHHVLIALKRFEEAEAIFENAKKAIKTFNDEYSLYLFSLIAGRHYKYKGEFDKASQYYDKIFEYGTKNGSIHNIYLFYTMQLENMYKRFEQDPFSFSAKEDIIKALSNFLDLNNQYKVEKAQAYIRLLRSDFYKLIGKYI